MSYRIPVTMTDHMKSRIEAYASTYGASISGALMALAARGLDQLEAAQAPPANASRRHRTPVGRPDDETIRAATGYLLDYSKDIGNATPGPFQQRTDWETGKPTGPTNE